MGGVYGPKQPQPVVLCLRIDGCTPLDLLRISEHLTPTTEAPSSSQSFRELPQREVRDGLCTSPLHHRYITRMAKYGEPRPRPIGLGPPAKGCHARGVLRLIVHAQDGGLDSSLRVRAGDA